MRTNIELDEALVNEALELTGERTRRAVVHRALEELVRQSRLRALRAERGTLKWRGDLAAMREETPSHGARRRHQRTD